MPTQSNDEIDNILANVWLGGFECRESGVLWGTEDFKSKSVDEAKEAIQRLIVEARIDENKIHHYGIQNAGLHEPSTVGLEHFTRRIKALQSSLNNKQEEV